MSLSLNDLKNDGIKNEQIIDPNVKSHVAEGVPVVDMENEKPSERKIVDVASMTQAKPVNLQPTPLDEALSALDERTASIKESFEEFDRVVERKKEDERFEKELEEDSVEEETSEELSDEDFDLEKDIFEADGGIAAVAEEMKEYSETIKKEAAENAKQDLARETIAPKEVVHANDTVDEIAKSNNFDLDYDDFSELDEDSVDEDEDESLKLLQDSISDKIKPVADKVDLKAFSIAKAPIDLNTAMHRTHKKIEKIGDWFAHSSKRRISFTAFTATDLEALSAASNGASNSRKLRQVYETFYNHIPENERPKSLETWLKSMSYFDNDDLYMAAYNVVFDGSNNIPYTCTDEKCANMWLSDSQDIMDMVKFKDEKVKELLLGIRNKDIEEGNCLYHSDIVQVSNDYAIGFREPSIYDMIIETASLDNNFKNKYADILAIVTYIDEIYYINRETGQLEIVDYKKYPGNNNKTVKSKILTYSKIIADFNSDQYNTVIAYMRKINEMDDSVKYVLPETTCPKCGKTIPAREQRAQDILFTRHQLAALMTI